MPPAKNKVSARNLTPKELGLMSLWIKQGAKADKKEEVKLEWQSVQTAVHDPIFTVALSPNGQFAAAGRSNRVDLYHVPTGIYIQELSDSKLGDNKLYEQKPAHLDYVTSSVFFPDNKRMATGSYREVKIWKMEEPKPENKAQIANYVGGGQPSSDGKFIAVMNDNSLSVFDSANGKQIRTFSTDSEFTAAGFSIDNQFVVGGTKTGGIHAWKVSDGTPVAEAELADNPISSVTATLEPLRLISGHNDNVLRVWEKPKEEGAKEWTQAREMKLHSKTINKLLPHPKSANSIYSAAEDGQIALWDVASGRNLNKASHGSPVVDLAINPAGDQFVSVGGKSAMLWGSDWKLIAELKGNVLRQNEYADAESAFAFASSEVKYRDTELKKAQDEHKKAQDRLKKAQEAKAKAEKEPVAEKKAELEKNETERDTIEKELKDLEEKIAKLKASSDSAEAERKKAETDYKAVQNELKTPQDQEAKTKKAVATAKAAFDQKAKAAKAIQDSKIKPQQDKIKGVDQKLAETQKVVDAATTALNEAGEDKAKKDAAQKALDEANAASLALEKQRQNLTKELTSIQVELKKATSEEAAARKSYDDAQKKAKVAKVAADKVRKKNEDAKKKLDVLTASKNKLSDELSKLQKEEEAPLKKKLADLQKKIDAERKEFDKINGPLQTAIRELANSEQDLKRTVQELANDQELKDAQDAQLKEVTDKRDQSKEASTASELPISSSLFSPDGKFIFTTGVDKQIHSWSAASGEPCHVFEPFPQEFHFIGFSLSDSVVCITQNGEIFSQSVSPGFKLEGKIGSALGESPIISRVTSLDVSPDGQFIAIGGGDPSRSGEIIIYDLTNNKVQGKFEDIHSDTVLDLDYSPDGKHIASASSDKFVKVFESTSGEVLRSFEGHTHHVLGVSWRRTGREIVSSGADNDIKYWNFENGDRLGKGGGFNKEVTSVHAIGVGNEAIVTSAEGKVSVVQLGTTIKKTADFNGAAKFTHVSDVTPDGSIVAAGAQDGILRIWTIKDRKLLHQLKPRIKLSDSLAGNK